MYSSGYMGMRMSEESKHTGEVGCGVREVGRRETGGNINQATFKTEAIPTPVAYLLGWRGGW